MLVLQSVATNKVARNDAALSFRVIFEPNNNHAMTLEAATPSVESILLAYF
jgi:hypothetical protein